MESIHREQLIGAQCAACWVVMVLSGCLAGLEVAPLVALLLLL